MKTSLASLLVLACYAMTSCTSTPLAAPGKTRPSIDNVAVSNSSFSIDCAPTSVTVTAHVTSSVGVQQVSLRYRVGSDRPFASLNMVEETSPGYRATVKGASLPPDRYGALEFYIAAQDQSGNWSNSAIMTSVQFLPCVSH